MQSRWRLYSREAAAPTQERIVTVGGYGHLMMAHRAFVEGVCSPVGPLDRPTRVPYGLKALPTSSTTGIFVALTECYGLILLELGLTRAPTDRGAGINHFRHQFADFLLDVVQGLRA